MAWFVRAWRSSKTDRKPVPGIDRDHCQSQVNQFLFCKVLLDLIVDLIRHLIFIDLGDCFSPSECCPLSPGIERRLAPGTYSIETLFALSTTASILGVHIDA